MSSPESVLRQLVWQEIHWPRPLEDEQAINLLRLWSAQSHAPQIILEARATRRGIRYLVGSQRRHASAIRRDIERLVAGTIVVADDGERLPAQAVRRVRVNTPVQSLEPRSAEGSTRSLLASLAAVQGDERLVIQIILGPRYAPQLTPRTIPQVDQGIASMVLRGIQPEQRRGVSRGVENKQGEHGFASYVRIGVSAKEEDRRRTLIGGVVSAFRSMVAPGLRFQVDFDHIQKLNHPSSEWPRFAFGQRLSAVEVGMLSAWPIGEGPVAYPGQPPAHPRQIRPSFAASSVDRIIASATAPGSTDVRLGLSPADSCHHVWAMGPTGVGKSSMLLSLIVDDMAAGRSCVVIEPKDLIRDVLKHVPADRQDDVVVLDPLDSEPVGINPLDGHGRSPALVADQLFGTFHALYGDQLGPRSSDILRHSLLALAQRKDASLAMLPILLNNKKFRQSVTQHIAGGDPFSAGPFWHWYEQLSPEASGQVTAPLMNKLRPLLDPHLRHVLAQPTPRFNVRQVLTQRKILLVPLQKGVLGPESAQLLGAMVVAELWQAIQERASLPTSDRHPVMVYLDEVQEYLRLPTDIGDALATSRGLGAAFHVAHQYLDQLPSSMRTAFEANCRSRVFFQLAARDAKAAAAMAPGLEPEDFMALPARHIYAQLVRGGAVTDWASGATLTVPKPTSSSGTIRARSRKQFGQSTEAIEQGLRSVLNPSAENEATSGRRRRSQP
ncbi:MULTISPECIES: type IV secretory system conjugative DNA transfer family protein [Paenarthrobacter]|uniref:Type IV secretion system DNA-binding domain-containing protein n=1 Tax=Paenarthrobacter ureafaciens TaxID=37931 RepID=A0AAX3EG53_PAEUR|nr:MULTISPECIES: type IV secretion system DNA-binding domain-containing protein [Paenarthrobacter]NKR11760.1 hypothetical protein [Arthrobacter sp. M5]NKR16894.1 hypothetical protein [Arthrobacter sp. M6]OEH60534.1 hypothetical protein A5N13_06165 [Arthrobacter sp. D4]OEH61149.1 hypothetical protein A5N17_17205 [Arthrobacter sp. D2]MDO5866093.1 type IV secretion system DNA-binding domain-containing protein [Paenarthrobacter sp. SD-2]